MYFGISYFTPELQLKHEFIQIAVFKTWFQTLEDSAAFSGQGKVHSIACTLLDPGNIPLY